MGPWESVPGPKPESWEGRASAARAPARWQPGPPMPNGKGLWLKRGREPGAPGQGRPGSAPLAIRR